HRLARRPDPRRDPAGRHRARDPVPRDASQEGARPRVRRARLRGPAEVSGAGFLGGGRPSGDAGPRPTTGHPVFLDFFYKLRAKGLKVGPQEWFALLQGLERGLAGESLPGLRHLARALLLHTAASY